MSGAVVARGVRKFFLRAPDGGWWVRVGAEWVRWRWRCAPPKVRVTLQ
mgnify:CR=1 FL=1